MKTIQNTNLYKKITAKRQNFFYGWIVAAASFLMVFVGLGLANSPSGLYITSVTEELGFSRGAFSLVFTFRFLSTAAFNMLFGFFVRKLEARKMVGLGFGVLAISYFLFSIAQNLILFYICGILYGAALAFCSTAMVSILIERWFIEKRGTVMGFVLAGSGLGGSLFSIVVSGWIQNYGWQKSYFFTAVSFIVFSIPILLAIRNSPDEKGLMPYGSGKEQTKSNKSIIWEGFTLEESLRKPYFYLAAICIFFVGFLNSPVFSIAPAHIMDRGMDPRFAASVMSIFFFTLAVAKVIVGFLFDRYGLKITLIVCFLSHICGILFLAFVQNKTMALIYAVIFGFSVPIETVTIPLMVFELFGSKTYRAVLGTFLAMSTIGVAISNPVINFSYDITGSYQGILLIYAVISVIMLTLLMYIMRCSQIDKKKYLVDK